MREKYDPGRKPGEGSEIGSLLRKSGGLASMSLPPLGGSSSALGGSGGMLTREDLFLNTDVKSINLLHFESKIKRSMDTSLNTHMNRFSFSYILQITPVLNCILVLSYSIS